MRIARVGTKAGSVLITMVAGLVLAGCTSSGTIGSPASGGGSGTGGGAGGGTGSGTASTGPTTSDAATPYVGDVALKPFYTQQIQWSACTKAASANVPQTALAGLQCGTLKVPLDYTHPAGDSIELAVVREPASDKAKRVGSLLTNPGGPGGSGLEFVEEAKSQFAQLNTDFDIVGFDPRGIGQSDPIHCLTDQQRDALSQEISPKDPVARKAKADQDGKSYAAACEANSGKLLPFIGTRTVARDMDVLRQVLGDKKLDYLGISYGTYLGSIYAEEFPQNVGHVVLDGAVDPNANQLEAGAQQQIGFEKSFERFAADCVTNHPADCPLGTDPKKAASVAAAFLDGLDAHPLAAGSRKLNSSLGWTGVIFNLYGDQAQSWSFLRLALTEAMRSGSGGALLVAADQYDGRDQSGHYSTEGDALTAVRCADFVMPQPSDAQVTQVYNELKQQAALLNSDLTKDDLSQPGCKDWPFQTTETPHTIKAAGAAPILVIGSTGDPATPYAAAVALAKGFDQATLLTRVGEGHGAFGKGNVCIDMAMDAYLVSGTLPASGTRCTR